MTPLSKVKLGHNRFTGLLSAALRHFLPQQNLFHLDICCNRFFNREKQGGGGKLRGGLLSGTQSTVARVRLQPVLLS